MTTDTPKEEDITPAEAAHEAADIINKDMDKLDEIADNAIDHVIHPFSHKDKDKGEDKA